MYLCHGERTCRWVNLCEHADAMFESPNVTTTKTLWWYGQNKQYIQTNKQLITQNINVAIIIPRRNKTVAQYCMKFIIPELKQCITSQKRAIKIFLEHKKKKNSKWRDWKNFRNFLNLHLEFDNSTWILYHVSDSLIGWGNFRTEFNGTEKRGT